MRHKLKTRVLARILVLLALAAPNLSADSPAPPRDYRIESANGQYVFVMLAPRPSQVDANPIRKQYSQSGLYKNDGSTSPLWIVDWYSFEVFVSSDGHHLVRMGPWASMPDDLALAFYRDGQEIRQYAIEQLVENPDFLQHSVSHFEWREKTSFSDESRRVMIATPHSERFVFDVTSGEIVESEKDDLHPSRLLAAADHGDGAAIQELLARGVDIDAKDPSMGFSPLHFAALRGHAGAVRTLLDWGAEVNSRSWIGPTPLMLAAAESDDVPTVKVLLEGGADVNAKDRNGDTALTIAEGRQHPAVAELLKRTGAGSEPPAVFKLELRKTFEHEIGTGEKHSYQIALKAGQFAQVTVLQKGVDVLVRVIGPDAKQLAEFDTPVGGAGPEPVSVFASVSGTYRLEVQPLESDVAWGRYDIQLNALRGVTPQDRSRAAAELRWKELDDTFNELSSHEKTAEAIDAGRASLHAAEETFGPRSPQAGTTANSLSALFVEQDNHAEAEQMARLALTIAEELGADHPNVAASLLSLGQVFAAQEKPADALPLLERAASIFEKTPATMRFAEMTRDMHDGLMQKLGLEVRVARRTSANMGAKDAEALAVLLLAAFRGDNAALGELLQRGADVNAQNKYGVRPLQVAAMNGHTDMVKALLKAGADKNAKTRTGMTALMFAAQQGDASTVRSLVDAGADVNAKSSTGATALTLAGDHVPVTELLKKAGTRP